jgi:hypothetical protein
MEFVLRCALQVEGNKQRASPPNSIRNNIWLNSQFGISDAETIIILSKCDQVTDRQASERNGAYGTDKFNLGVCILLRVWDQMMWVLIRLRNVTIVG